MKKLTLLFIIFLTSNYLVNAQSSTRSSHWNDEKNFNGSYNAFYGKETGENTTSGAYYNTNLGVKAGLSLTSGDNNLFLGYNSGNDVTTGSGNIFIGYWAGSSSGNTSDQLFIDNSSSTTPLIWGDFSTNQLQFNGDVSIVGNLGVNDLIAETIAAETIEFNDLTTETLVATDITTTSISTTNLSYKNSDVGWDDYGNLFFGHEVLVGMTSNTEYNSGMNNVAIGYRAGKGQANVVDAIWDASNAVFIGAHAGELPNPVNNQIPMRDAVFIGYKAGQNAGGSLSELITFGDVYIGAEAGMSTVMGRANVYIGRHAGRLNDGGSTYGSNVFVGYNCGDEATGATQTVALGAGVDVSTSASNGVALGNNSFIGGAQNIAIGMYSSAGDGITNSIALGYDAEVTSSNQVRIGNSSTTSIGGQVSWSTLSDGRFKTDIKENVPGLEFINSLRPVTYKVDLAKLANQTKSDVNNGAMESKSLSSVTSGFIAQEVEKLVKDKNYQFDAVDSPENENGNYAIRYSEFVVPLTKAIQELSQLYDEQVAKIAELEEQLATLKGSTPNANNSQIAVDTFKGAVLHQNRPNPSTSGTKIDVELNSPASLAQLIVYNMQGQELKSFRINNSGITTIDISHRDFSNGLYYYALIVDGELIDTKKMAIK